MKQKSKRPLSPEEMKRIDEKYSDACEKNYYDLMGIPADASRNEIKNAYRNISRDFHPDNFFLVDLGEYREKLDFIFDRVNRAYNTLNDPLLRRSYNSTLVEEEESSRRLEPESVSIHEIEFDFEERKRREERLQKMEELKREMRNRIAGRSRLTQAIEKAMVENIRKAKQFYRDAKEMLRKGDVIGAYNAIQLAISFDERDEAYQELKNAIHAKLKEEKARALFERGKKAESMIYNDDALKNYEEAMKLDEKNPLYPFTIASILTKDTNDAKTLERAVRYAERAVQLDHKNMEYLEFLAFLCRETGKKERLKEVEKKIKMLKI